MVHSSSVTEVLTYFRRNNHSQANDTFDTEMDIYLPPGNGQAQSPRPTVEDESALSLGGVPVFQCLGLLQESQPQHPTWHLQMSPMLN